MTEQQYKKLKKGDKLYYIDSVNVDDIRIKKYTFVRYQTNEECRACGNIEAKEPRMVLKLGKNQIFACWQQSLFVSLIEAIEREIEGNLLYIEEVKKINERLAQMLSKEKGKKYNEQ